MSYSRRQLLGAGLSAGFLATAAQGQTLAQIVAGLKDPQPRPLPAGPLPVRPLVVPARPRVAVDGVIDPRLLARARASFDRHRSRLRYTDVVGIADFSRPSNEHRFFLLDTASGRVSNHLVAHGRGSDPAHSGLLERFSNRIGSEASSQGGYRTGEYYHGKYGRSLRLSGLDWSNSNAETRAIVVHSAWYAEPTQLAAHGKLGRSEGCFALPYNSLQQVLARLGPGRFIYADKLA
ncbi:MAG: murein L,D-transpeptidase catalytic domain-containing protein [Allosphingosinicella sp.]